MSQNGNAVIRDKVPCSVSLITGYPLTCAELAFTGVYSGVMMDFLQVCPFTGIGFSTMFDFHKCVLSLVCTGVSSAPPTGICRQTNGASSGTRLNTRTPSP